MNKLKITASHSSGPGGQNVNNTNTKIDLRFKLAEADWIPEEIRNTMQTKFRTHVSREGYFIIQSDRTRSQHLNTADALEKLRECIRECKPHPPTPPPEETIEKFRKVHEKAVRDRLREKKDRHMIKSYRGGTTATQLEA
jgi:peptidyl-tRNA hydrolase ICT1